MPLFSLQTIAAGEMLRNVKAYGFNEKMKPGKRVISVIMNKGNIKPLVINKMQENEREGRI